MYWSLLNSIHCSHHIPLFLELACRCELVFAARKAESSNTEKEKELKEELEDLRRQLKATKEELASHAYAVEKCESWCAVP